MKFPTELLHLDYLVYSSYKSGTQTLTNTLKSNGFKCKHWHRMRNYRLQKGQFRPYLRRYLKKNNEKLKVITVFRDPMKRHASSFFQGYGAKPLRLKEVKSKKETLVYKLKTKELQEKYIAELRDKSLIGFHESLHEIFEELQISADDLNYDKEKQFGVFENRFIKLFFFEFDTLFNNFEHLLQEITQHPIAKNDSNISEAKWYGKKYADFKSSLVIPEDIITEVYQAKRDLINLFYDKQFDNKLSQALTKYEKKKTRN